MSIDPDARVIGEVAAALAAHTGLDFAGSHRGRMRSAIERELRETSSRTCTEYVANLERDPDANARLIDRLTVGETYFFRDPAQIELLRTVVGSWTAAPGTRRVWSAGCATGEEPYTLAMVLDDAGMLGRTHIVGTDLSERAIEHARQAVYGRWSLRRTDLELQHRYFVERHGRHALHPRLAEAVEYRVRNLLDGPPAVAAYDLVLCRNVLIYLHDEALESAACALRDALAPRGQLVVGVSDPPLSIEGLELVRTRHGFLYQRLGGDPESPPGATDPRRPDRIRRPEPRRRRRPVRTAPGNQPRPRRTDAPRRTPSPMAQIADAVTSLAAAGRISAAEGIVASAVDERPLDATTRVLDATLHIRAGRLTEAAAAAGAAVYLEPELVVAHLLLGHIELQRSRPIPARRSLATAIELLSEMPTHEEVPGTGGERVESVLAVVTQLLHTTEQEQP